MAAASRRQGFGPVIQVDALAPSESDAWDDFLRSTPAGLIYHSTRYRDLLVDHLGCEAEYLVARDGDRITGVLPVMWAESEGRRVANSLPFYGSHGGPLASDAEAEAALVEAWNERATDSSTTGATLIANPFLDHEPSVSHDLVDERISQVTPLPAGADAEAVMALIDSSARRNARKAERAGIAVESDPSAWSDLHEIHAENMSAIGGLAKERSFFEAVPRHLRPGEDFDIWVARLDGRTISALLVMHFGETTEYYTPATRHENRSDQPLALILVEAMVNAAKRGSRMWNWGGTWTSQDGVYRFKHKWGAEDGRYRYFTQVNDRSILKSSPEELLERFPHFFVVPFSALGQS
jgi:hypothetical protein